jgi:hypothetical protein
VKYRRRQFQAKAIFDPRKKAIAVRVIRSSDRRHDPGLEEDQARKQTVGQIKDATSRRKTGSRSAIRRACRGTRSAW